MAGLPRQVRVHEVDVEPYRGDGATGPTFGPTFRLRGLVEDAPRTVRTADAREVLSSGTAYVDLDPEVSPEDRVTHRGRTRRVLAVARREFSAATPNHQEVSLE